MDRFMLLQRVGLYTWEHKAWELKYIRFIRHGGVGAGGTIDSWSTKEVRKRIVSLM